MYKIIGADQKEYGPISADQIRQWISEGRANGQTLVCAEGTTDWKPLEQFPEFGLAANPIASGIPGAESSRPLSEEELLAADYSLDIGACASKGWDLVKANFWPIVGISFVNMIALSGINQLLGLISRPSMNAMLQQHEFTPAGIALVVGTMIAGMPFSTVLMGGLFRYYLKIIRGQPATIADAFSGFSHGFAQLAILGLVQGILIYLGFALCLLPGIYLAVAWYFAVFLIADQGMDFWSAMELSRKVVTKHWFMVFGFMLVMGLLAAAGLIACCIGVLVSMPVGMLAIALGYETIFRRKNT